jgi:hypothetical protein
MANRRRFNPQKEVQNFCWRLQELNDRAPPRASTDNLMLWAEMLLGFEEEISARKQKLIATRRKKNA